jgi:hypothetical protein
MLVEQSASPWCKEGRRDSRFDLVAFDRNPFRILDAALQLGGEQMRRGIGEPSGSLKIECRLGLEFYEVAESRMIVLSTLPCRQIVRGAHDAEGAAHAARTIDPECVMESDSALLDRRQDLLKGPIDDRIPGQTLVVRL